MVMQNWMSMGMGGARRFACALLCAAGIYGLLPVDSVSQDRDDRPHPPAIERTTQVNPRGADIVEPMTVLRITRRRGAAPDTTYLGTAKIPDPRRGEVGAFTNNDVATGALIRISDAMIMTGDGLQRIVEFDPRAAEDLLVFAPGPHDVVTSRQSVAPRESIAGRIVTFDINELYEAAGFNPLTGITGAEPRGGARVALLRMESTFPRGEAVNLVIPLVPQIKPGTITTIRVVHRDTTILPTPPLNYVLKYPESAQRHVSILATIETGYGPRFVHTGIPAGTRPDFVTRGWADTYHVDGTIRFERPTHRWRVHLFGMSSLVNADVTAISHHQITLLGDLRFEYGEDTYVAIEAAGSMRDKPHQEFDWNSADYYGGVYVGPGRREIDLRGLETQRVELLLGLRMGENRPIEVYQAGQRARGMGPELVLAAHRNLWRWRGMEVHLRGTTAAYIIAGRGARDSGFRERGVRATAELNFGQELLGMYVFGGARAMARRDRAKYPEGDRYFMNDALITPAVGVELRL